MVTLAYAFVLHEQLAARPWVASPNSLWRQSAESLNIPIEPSVSIVRNEPFLALGAPLANMLALICSFIICIDRDRARQLLLVVAWSGVAYAIYGIAAYLIDPTHVLWREAPALAFALIDIQLPQHSSGLFRVVCRVVVVICIATSASKRATGLGLLADGAAFVPV